MARYFKSYAKFYGVRRGHKPGVYTSWSEAEDQIENFIKPEFRKFKTRGEAEAFVSGPDQTLKSYEALMEKYLAGDRSVLPRLKCLAEGMNKNGNSANPCAAKSDLHLDAVRHRRSVYDRTGSRSSRRLARRVFAARAGVASAAGNNRRKV